MEEIASLEHEIDLFVEGNCEDLGESFECVHSAYRILFFVSEVIICCDEDSEAGVEFFLLRRGVVLFFHSGFWGSFN